jgi:multicomponent Na+:H+ antiporter subunit G
MEILSLIGGILALNGALILVVASLGLVRMPDIYNRMQTGTKATTLGTIFFFVGVGFYHPEWFPKILILIVFIAFTNPISSHVLTRAAHYLKIPLTEKTKVDKLAGNQKEGES